MENITIREYYDSILKTEEGTKEFLYSKDALFHYTSSQTAIEFILQDLKLRLSPIYNLADPFENFDYSLPMVITDNDFYKVHQERYVIQENMKILCFSSNIQDVEERSFYAFERIHNDYDTYLLPKAGFDKSRMWDNYAGRYSGVCIIFSKEELLNELRKNNINHFSRQVAYYKNIIERLQTFSEQFSGIKQSKHFVYNRLLLKDFDYRDECEFRIIIEHVEKGYFYIDVSKAIKGIIFGVKFKDIYLPIYKQWKSKHNKNIFTLKYDLEYAYPFKTIREV